MVGKNKQIIDQFLDDNNEDDEKNKLKIDTDIYIENLPGQKKRQ